MFDRMNELRLVLQDVADRSGYSRGYIGRVVREPVAPHISDDFVERVAAALEESADTFRRLGGLKRPNPYDVDPTKLGERGKAVLEVLNVIQPSEPVFKAWLALLPTLEGELKVFGAGGAGGSATATVVHPGPEQDEGQDAAPGESEAEQGS